MKALLDETAARYNHVSFIKDDPICIPHMFRKKQDIEIAGFFAAVLAWGRRPVIIKNCLRLMELMGGSPHAFILEHREQDLRAMQGFAHRTFNDTDLLYFLHLLQIHYREYDSLEDAFVPGAVCGEETTEQALIRFHRYFFSPEHPARTRKHIATPERNSACKRLNMFLRWMVRSDDAGVDFGIWNKISMAQLVCPMDVHVIRVAGKLGLIADERSDWRNALQLTARLREYDPEDPVRYDYALFGMGADGRF